MILNKIDDPRDSLQKARRYELFQFAQAQGVKEIVHEMPAIMMRRILREKGLTNIKIPPRVLGSQNQPNSVVPGPDQKVVEVDAADDLARQFKAQQLQPAISKPAIPKRGRPKLEINELRDECKRLGIKLSRRDRMDDMREKIKNVKDASQLRQ